MNDSKETEETKSWESKESIIRINNANGRNGCDDEVETIKVIIKLSKTFRINFRNLFNYEKSFTSNFYVMNLHMEELGFNRILVECF